KFKGARFPPLKPWAWGQGDKFLEPRRSSTFCACCSTGTRRTIRRGSLLPLSHRERKPRLEGPRRFRRLAGHGLHLVQPDGIPDECFEHGGEGLPLLLRPPPEDEKRELRQRDPDVRVNRRCPARRSSDIRMSKHADNL